MEPLQRRNRNHLEPEEPSKEKDSKKIGRLLSPWASYPRLWNKIFLASCVLSVLFDPLFLYVPVINENGKCLKFDQKMKVIALVLRTATDLFYVFHVLFRLTTACAIAIELRLSVFNGFPWKYLLIDVLAVLPLPQVIILKYPSKLAGSRSLMTRKVLNFLLLIQYAPRLLRVYLSAKELGRSFDSLTRRVWVRAAFFFFLYISFGHIFGAFWYFYAIFRETACWHQACKNLDGCVPSPFDCQMTHPLKNNLRYLDKTCPVRPPNPTEYDFGLFTDAVKSGILTDMKFTQKFSRCFWWGLKNLSSFGQNLDTSTNVEENLFASLISILGLLLFLYLIGNVQTYIQLETTKSEEARRKIMIRQPEIESYLSTHNLPVHKKEVIERYLRLTIKDDRDFDIKCLFSLLEELPDHSHDETFAAWVTKLMDLKKRERITSDGKAERWISKNGFTPDMKKKIMRYVRLRLQEGKDVDVGNILPILPSELGMSVKKLLCFPSLKKVPMLRNMEELVHEKFCNFLKPAVYAEKSYIIRKEEPLDFILLITQGVMWSFGNNGSLMERLQKGDFFGKELLEWKLNSACYSQFPVSEASLKCHTKVEAFVLLAADLEPILSHCWSQFSSPSEAFPEGLKHFAAAFLQQGFRRYIRNKKSKSNQLAITIGARI